MTIELPIWMDVAVPVANFLHMYTTYECLKFKVTWIAFYNIKVFDVYAYTTFGGWLQCQYKISFNTNRAYTCYECSPTEFI